MRSAALDHRGTAGSTSTEAHAEKAYAILDELIMGGEMTETSKKAVLRAVRRRASVSR